MSSDSSNLRLVAVFLMGLSVGICLMLVYITLRAGTPSHPITPSPSAEVEPEP